MRKEVTPYSEALLLAPTSERHRSLKKNRYSRLPAPVEVPTPLPLYLQTFSKEMFSGVRISTLALLLCILKDTSNVVNGFIHVIYYLDPYTSFNLIFVQNANGI